MRFALRDEKRRAYGAERWCYLGSTDDWIDIGLLGSVDKLAGQFIPLVGSDALCNARMWSG